MATYNHVSDKCLMTGYSDTKFNPSALPLSVDDLRSEDIWLPPLQMVRIAWVDMNVFHYRTSLIDSRMILKL